MTPLKLRQVTLEGFGLYGTRATFALAPGLSVLTQPNESGKSTLLAGILATLFGLPEKTDPDAWGTARYRNWSGTVRFQGDDLFLLKPKAFKEARRHMQMIFQDPFSSLNPRFTVYDIIKDPLYIRGGASEATMKDKVLELLKLVGLDEEDLYRYPSDFSGGQRQRIGIARAIVLNPRFLVCDEPVSGLDVSVHAQILNLLMEIQKSRSLTYVFISHNLAVVKNICKTMLVMYLGKAMEAGVSDAIFANPLHPYTKALLSAVLDINVQESHDRILLKGDAPSPIDPPKGCRFWQRCPSAMIGCETIPVELIEVERDHQVACHLVSGFSSEDKAAGLDRPVSPPPGG